MATIAPGSPGSYSRPEELIRRIGPMLINPYTHDVRVDGIPVDLTPTEYRLLWVLASAPTRVFTREELLRKVWGYVTESRTLDSYAARLRGKLLGREHRLVINVWGIGYRLTDVASETDPEQVCPGCGRAL